MPRHSDYTRRRLLLASVSTLGLSIAGRLGQVVAGNLAYTPPQPRGPFYPVEIPLDSDNDLVTVEGRPGVARGEITNLTGRVLDERGRPVPEARVEIWQCDAHGRYRHPGDRQNQPLDPYFQGYGKFQTGDQGRYRFRTIKPVAYPGRAPHIHFTISGPGFEPLTTQMYVAGAPENASDWILNRLPRRTREQLIVPLNPAVSAKDELSGVFDIVLAGERLI